MSEEMHKGTLTLPKADYKALKHRATDEGVDIQDLILEAVRLLLSRDISKIGDVRAVATGVSSEIRGAAGGLSKREAEGVIKALRKQADDLEAALGNRPSGGTGATRGRKTA